MKYVMTKHGLESELKFGKLTISGDETKGFTPYQLMVSSLVGCSGGVLRKVCEKMRMPMEHMELDVLRNPEEANRLEKLHSN